MAVLPANVMGTTTLSHVGFTLLAQGVAGGEPRSAWDVLRHDVIPVGTAYLVFMGILITYRRATREAPRKAKAPGRWRPIRAGATRDGTPPGWSDLVRFLVAMVAGGYAFFLAIVVVFYFILGGEDTAFIRQALVEGSLLAFVLVLPAFLLLSLVEDLLRRRGDDSTRR